VPSLSAVGAGMGGRASSTGRAGRNPQHTWAAKRTAETAAEPTRVTSYNEDGDDLKEGEGRRERKK
jgi:hypothetical protein